MVLPSSGVSDDGDKASVDGRRHGLALPHIAGAPPALDFLDSLDNGEPLSAIEDDDKDEGMFYGDMPQATSCRVKL